VGEESGSNFTARTSLAAAELLARRATAGSIRKAPLITTMNL
jgi:hypothetical protein